MVLTKTVPEHIKLSEPVKNAILVQDLNPKNVQNIESILIEVDDIEDKVKVSELKCDLKCTQTELICAKELNTELKNRIGDLEKIISLLESQNPKIQKPNPINTTILSSNVVKSNILVQEEKNTKIKGKNAKNKEHENKNVITKNDVSNAILEAEIKAKVNELTNQDQANKIIGSNTSGENIAVGKYKVDDVVQEEREDCYLATLHIKDASATDSRAYYLAVENDRGTDRHAVQLYVNEPLQMSTLVTVAGVMLVAFLLLICVCIYAIRTEKCCFSSLQKQNTLKIGTRVLSPDFFDSEGVNDNKRVLENVGPMQDKSKYYSFSRYDDYPDKTDNWSYSTMQMGSHRSSFPSDSRHVRRSLNNKKYHKKDSGTRSSAIARPKPLQYDNEKYYDHVFPKRDGALYAPHFYQPNCYDHAEL
ncbi:unnamed protein product [Brassicogethes aeneus]|uniref:Uncharacterized protein n=1 Tax=Brassicogethes aeneus TaxID=1431903 RepID=A0A9P0ARR4_BRAAE|nr:unnamed protein product [Brassicogethes aeneus]